jgi:hypothetical protein
MKLEVRLTLDSGGTVELTGDAIDLAGAETVFRWLSDAALAATQGRIMTYRWAYLYLALFAAGFVLLVAWTLSTPGG